MIQEETNRCQSFVIRHWIISFFRNINLPGFRKVSLLLPKWLLPPATSQAPHFIATQNKLWVWIDPATDDGVERSLYETGWYERGVLTWLSANLITGKVFIDVGANIGIHALHAANCVGSKGQVWAFEAHPNTFARLEKNIEKNKMPQIHAFQCGIGEANGIGKLYSNWSINKGASSKYQYTSEDETVDVQILPLDQIVAQHGLLPSVVKIDVEGMELEVLNGARECIEKYRPTLIIEFSVDRKEQVHSRLELYNAIKSFGFYKMYNLHKGKERDGKLIEITKVTDLPTDDNVFCIAN